MANKARYTGPLMDWDTSYIFSDFNNFTTAQDGWTSLVADAGTSAAVSDARKGILALGTGATDNNEADVRTTNELYIFTAGKPIYGRIYFQYAEANTDDANIFVGFMSALAANSIVDDGASVRASGSICGIYKLDGGTVWRCHTRDNGGADDSISTLTAGGSSYILAEIFIEDYTSTLMQAKFAIDGEWLRDSNNTLIVHNVTIASATEMNFGFYVKAGGANAETLNIDAAYAHQYR